MFQRARIHLLTLSLGLFLIFTPKVKADYSYPGFFGVLGVVPGVGHFAQGEFLEGLGWAAVSVGPTLYSRNVFIQIAAQNLWFYSIFDAYKDAGAKNTSKNNVYSHYVAAFNPVNLFDYYSPVIVGVGASSMFAVPPDQRSPEDAIGPRPFYLSPLFFAFVGLGEEALFRGFLFPTLSSVFFGSKHLGAISSSALFSAAHIMNGPGNDKLVPLLSRFLLGMAFAYQTASHKMDIRHSIFAHAWYDVSIDYALAGTQSETQQAKWVPIYKIRLGTRF